MYWIYLVIFVGIVLIPRLVDRGLLGFDVVQTQQFAILLLGSLAALAFHAMEIRLKKSKVERSSMLKKVSRMAKELTNTYTYIGEVNRKIDILQNITRGLPEISLLARTKRLEIYESIMAAIKLFGKSDDFKLKFVDQQTHEVLKEIKSPAASTPELLCPNCPSETQFFEDENFIVTTSSRTIDDIASYIIIRKKKPARPIDDPEILKTLATQALFLFMLLQYKNPAETKTPAA